MKSILLFAFLLFLSNSFAQLDKRVYLNEDFDTCSIAQARYYTEFKRSETDQHVLKNVYKLDGSLISVITFLNDSLKDFDGPYYTFYDNGQMEDSMFYINDELNGNFRSYFESGQLKVKGNYLEGEFQDSLLTFYVSGNKKRVDVYDIGKLIQGSVYDDQGNTLPYENYFVEGSFPDGDAKMMMFIMTNMVYPQDAIMYNITGKVYVKFIVDSLGKVKNVTEVKSISPVLTAAAIEVMEKMPRWIPSKIDGENCDSYFQLPINFNLEGSSKKFTKRMVENLFWVKGEKLIDPMINQKIILDNKGKTLIYYREAGSDHTKSIRLTMDEMENFRHIKFINEDSCNDWYKLFYEAMVEELINIYQ